MVVSDYLRFHLRATDCHVVLSEYFLDKDIDECLAGMRWLSEYLNTWDPDIAKIKYIGPFENHVVNPTNPNP